MYLAILFATNPETGETFSCSTEVEDDADKNSIYNALKKMSHCADNSFDTILVVESGSWEHAPPAVIDHWTAANGDFEECSE
jgi:hypothetical protein